MSVLRSHLAIGDFCVGLDEGSRFIFICWCVLVLIMYLSYRYTKVLDQNEIAREVGVLFILGHRHTYSYAVNSADRVSQNSNYDVRICDVFTSRRYRVASPNVGAIKSDPLPRDIHPHNLHQIFD
jgi:hypothetical protein